MGEFGYYLDILAVSCDSFDSQVASSSTFTSISNCTTSSCSCSSTFYSSCSPPAPQHAPPLAPPCSSTCPHLQVNDRIGRRGAGGGAAHLASLARVRSWCDQYGVLFKLNTVVNSHNWGEDMVAQVAALRPVRWKVFQCLAIGAENQGEGALRQVEEFLVTEEQWQAFLSRHSSLTTLVPESNEAMRNSYLILDEYMRFLDNSGGTKAASCSLLDVGVAAAMDRAGFDQAMFLRRGGKYKWSKQDHVLDW